jgi:hypothetical protein
MQIDDFTKAFKTVWGAGVVVAVAGPLGLFVPDLYPPWPDNSHLIGVVFCAVAAVVSFTVGVGYAQRPATKRTVQTAVAIACAVIGLASLIAYFMAYSTRVVVEPQMIGKEQRELRFVVGTQMRADVDKTASGVPLELLRDNQYSPEKVWTPESLRNSRFLLLITFVTAFAMLTFGMGLLATRAGTDLPSRSS